MLTEFPSEEKEERHYFPVVVAGNLAGKPKKTTKGMVERWNENKHSDEVRNQRKQWRKVDGFMHLRM